jgi:hypothetical protein
LDIKKEGTKKAYEFRMLSNLPKYCPLFKLLSLQRPFFAESVNGKENLW